jgi:hypothetical protein
MEQTKGKYHLLYLSYLSLLVSISRLEQVPAYEQAVNSIKNV